MNVNGDRVKQAREITGLTQVELAERVGVSQPTIAYIERTISQQLFEPAREIIESIATNRLPLTVLLSRRIWAGVSAWVIAMP